MINSDYRINIECFEKDQMLDKRAIGSGIYIIELLVNDDKEAIPLYIGKSEYILKRCGEHLYTFFKRPCYFGLSEANMAASNLLIRFRVLEQCPSADLFKKETTQICRIHPILQHATNDRMLGIGSKMKILEKVLKNKLSTDKRRH
jgi:hypothetical protein